jgi:hypothetical protein
MKESAARAALSAMEQAPHGAHGSETPHARNRSNSGASQRNRSNSLGQMTAEEMLLHARGMAANEGIRRAGSYGNLNALSPEKPAHHGQPTPGKGGGRKRTGSAYFEEDADVAAMMTARGSAGISKTASQNHITVNVPETSAIIRRRQFFRKPEAPVGSTLYQGSVNAYRIVRKSVKRWYRFLMDHHGDPPRYRKIDDASIAQKQRELNAIFLFSSPLAYYHAVEFGMLLQCLYLALWATNFSVMAVHSGYNVLWQFAMVIPVLFNILLLKQILFIACLLKSVSALDSKIADEITEMALDERIVTHRLRKTIRAKLHEINLDKKQWSAFVATQFGYFVLDGRGVDPQLFGEFLHSLQIFLTSKSVKSLFKVIDFDADGIVTWPDLAGIIFPEHRHPSKDKMDKDHHADVIRRWSTSSATAAAAAAAIEAANGMNFGGSSTPHLEHQQSYHNVPGEENGLDSALYPTSSSRHMSNRSRRMSAGANGIRGVSGDSPYVLQSIGHHDHDTGTGLDIEMVHSESDMNRPLEAQSRASFKSSFAINTPDINLVDEDSEDDDQSRSSGNSSSSGDKEDDDDNRSSSSDSDVPIDDGTSPFGHLVSPTPKSTGSHYSMRMPSPVASPKPPLYIQPSSSQRWSRTPSIGGAAGGGYLAPSPLLPPTIAIARGRSDSLKSVGSNRSQKSQQRSSDAVPSAVPHQAERLPSPAPTVFLDI